MKIRRPRAPRRPRPPRAPKVRAERGVKLMQSHNPAVLAGLAIQGSLMGPDEYAHDIDPRRPWQNAVADYEVRQSPGGEWGIWTRKYNMRVATFAPNSAALRDALARMFDAALVLRRVREGGDPT